MDIAIRLRNIIAFFHLNQEKLAKLMQLSQGSVSMLLKNQTAPSFKSLSNLCRALPDLNPDYLLNGTGDLLRSDPSAISFLPIVGQIAAGPPVECKIIDPIKYIPWDIKSKGPSKHITCFQVSGDSMSPLILNNDIVIIKSNYTYNDLNNSIIAIRINTEITLKQLVLDKTNQSSILMPINTCRFNPIVLNKDTQDDIQIIGKMIHLIRSF